MPTELSRLFSGLYAALSTDPQAVPALSIVLAPLAGVVPSAYWITIGDDHLSGTTGTAQSPQGPIDPVGTSYGHAALDLDLLAIPRADGSTGATLGDLVAYLNRQPGFTATLLPGVNPAQYATALVDGSFNLLATTQLAVTTSLLWAMFKPMAWLLRRAHEEGGDGLRDSQPLSAQGFWLSTLGDLYGVDRYAGESDDQYRTRILYSVIKPRCNNVAMEEYLRWSLGLADVTVTDDPSVQFRFLVNLTLPEQGGFTVPMDRIRTIVDAIKAWGVIWLVTLTGKDTETFDVTQVTQVKNALRIGGFSDLFEVRDTIEKYRATVTQHSYETARATSFYLYTNVWKDNNTGKQIPNQNVGEVTSQTNDARVLLASAQMHWKSYVQGIIDLWSSLPETQPDSETWTVATSVTANQRFAIGQTDDGRPFMAGITEAFVQHVGQRIDGSPAPRRKQLYTNIRFSLTNDANALVSAPLPAGRYATSVGDPSWVIIS